MRYIILNRSIDPAVELTHSFLFRHDRHPRRNEFNTRYISYQRLKKVVLFILKRYPKYRDFGLSPAPSYVNNVFETLLGLLDGDDPFRKMIRPYIAWQFRARKGL